MCWMPGSSERPLLVIDQAYNLMAWSGRYDKELRYLLSFFVDITKASRRIHVLLATSEDAFQPWLDKEIGPTFWESRVLGEFTRSEAKDFLNLCLGNLGQRHVSKRAWTNVYKVCGGNAAAWIPAANRFSSCKSWQIALVLVSEDVWTTMKPGYRPAPGARYSAADYATAVTAILDSGCKAVHDAKLEAVLGTEALEAMVKGNLLAVCPYSHWAADIDAAAFGPDQLFTVVAAPTLLHYYVMEAERSTLTAALHPQTPQ